MDDKLTEESWVIVQKILNNYFTIALDECLKETDVKATVAFGIPAFARAIGGLLGSCGTEEGMEAGLRICVNEIRRSMKYAFEIYPKGMVQ